MAQASFLDMERKHAVEAAAAELAASARGSVPTIRPVQAGPLIGLIAQVLLLAALAGVVARSGAGLGAARAGSSD